MDRLAAPSPFTFETSQQNGKRGKVDLIFICVRQNQTKNLTRLKLVSY